MNRDALKAALEWANWIAGNGERPDNYCISIRERVAALSSALRDAWAEIDRLKEQYARIIVQTKRFEEGNCPICGYNGPGYFQPDKHPCAKYYHEAGINPSLDEALNSGDGSYKP